MTSSLIFIILFALVALVTKYGVEIYCIFAPKFGLVDKPDQQRKIHKQAVPVGGGVVIFLMFVLFSLLASFFPLDVPTNVDVIRRIFLPVCIASLILVCVGLVDDRFGMKGKVKLAFQVLAASILIACAREYSQIILFGYVFDLGHLFYPLGVIWLVGMINAINLLDGADGVASTTGFCMTITIACLASINGHVGLFYIAIAFSGVIFGFFLCNRPPARVYLGDTGSMFIGFTVGILLLRVSVVGNRDIYVISPLAVALIPILDSVFAIVRRKNSGRGIFSPDRGHIHHRLLIKFGKNYETLGILILLILPGCIAAIAGTYFRNDWIPALTCIVVVVAAAITGIFGREELKIIIHRVANRFRKRLQRDKYDQTGEVFHFQGNGPWELLWGDFIPALKRFHCVRAHLDINMPFLHEDYSSEWENMELHNKSKFNLSCSVPLVCESQKVGMLNMTFDTCLISNVEALQIVTDMSDFCVKYIADYINQKIQNGTISRKYIEIKDVQKTEVSFLRFDSAFLRKNHVSDPTL